MSSNESRNRLLWGLGLLSATLMLLPGCGSGGDDTQSDIGDTGDIDDTGDVGDQGEVPENCGDGTVDPGEQCDDGNAVNGDGCESNCTWTCDPADDDCPAEQHCDTTTHMCVPGCRADEGCAAPTPYCDVEDHACVLCVLDDHCETGYACVDNICVESCSATNPCSGGRDCCGGACIDTDTSLTHCGACDATCAVANGTPACVAGVCTVQSCDAGYADCNTTAADGCEIATSGDVANCGSCANACPARASAAATCTDGACGFTCDAGYADCDALGDNGCEVELATSAEHCGACGTACVAAHGTPACVAGACAVGTCETGWGDCNATASDGCETELTTLTDCGACGTACGTPANGSAACRDGACAIAACDAGYTDCDADFGTGCEVNTGADPAHCGACTNVCAVPNATAGCVAGLCTVGACTGSWRDCNGTVADGCEIDSAGDVANCGACGTVCATPAHGIAGCAGSTCGVASCDTGWGNCDGVVANGCETDTTSSISHCGTCGTVCPAPLHAAASCAAGTCGMGACNAGWGDCNTDPVDGCETALNTIINCGGCGVVCSSNYGTASCPGTPSACAIACYANYGNCDGNVSNGCEVDLRTDNSNCGTCGNVCAGGRVCVSSTCQLLPPSNDLRTGAITISMTTPYTRIRADTTSATNNTSGTCGCTSGNDVFYTFTLTAPELVYADTIGTTWNTSLFFQNSAGVNLTTPGVTPGAVCSDDGGVGCASGQQSMVLAYLPAGTYFLVLSGCASGVAQINFHHLPVGNGSLVNLPVVGGLQTFTGTTSGTGRITTTCGGGGTGPEHTYFFVTCPTFTAQAFTASTVGGATWDTVLEQRSAARTPLAACNDDQCDGAQSTVASSLAAGAGLHTLYLDGYGGSSGAYTLRVQFGGCAAGQTLCGAACRALQTDVDNCGCCGRVCTAYPNSTRGCAAGACGIGSCNAGWGNCDGVVTNGCETNTTNNNSHCGACGTVCAAGTTCVASACRPTNDRCAGATIINLGLGSRIALSGRTTNAYHDLTASCSTTATSPDVYYTFTLTQREMVYANTFGSGYDTVLNFASGCATNLPGPTTTGGVVCNEDTCATQQSAVQALLNPGTYYLLVSGFNGASGTFTLTLEHLPVGNGPVGQVNAGTAILSGTTAGTGVMNQTCGAAGTSPENTYWWVTCPTFVSAAFSATTCGGATWDTVLALRNGSGAGNLCNDDTGGTCGWRSTISGNIPAGAGIHTLYIDGYGNGSLGTYAMSVTRP